ncbi:MAG: murein biosynthesis integral membrane protein MurJ [Rhizobiaceae bacterium]
MGLIAKFASVGSATMASRILGFAREALIGAALGAGPVADAFYAAFRFPNLFRRIFAEGAFNAAFVPLFARELEGGGREAARRFAESVLAILIPVLLALSALAILFMPALVAWIIAPGFSDDPAKFNMTVFMTRIMFPYLFCMSMVAMLSGILNSMRRYFLAAFVPVLLNVILVSVLLFGLLGGLSQSETGHLMAWGVFASGVAQLFFLIWGVRREGFSMTFVRPRMNPGVNRLLVLMGPLVLTGGATQINLLVGQIIASAQDGAIALLNYADRVNQLPLGVIGIAVGVVLLPELSRALKAGNAQEAAHLQNRSTEFALGLTVPAAVGLMVLAAPIINILYERGAFTAETTALTAAALVAFASGLPAYVMIKVFQASYFAREDTKTPMWFAFVQVAANIVLSLLFFPVYGHVAIAAATSVSAWMNAILLAVVLWRTGYFRLSAVTAKNLVLIVLASAIMGVVIYLLLDPLSDWTGSAAFFVRLIAVTGLIGAGCLVYFSVVLATGAVDHRQLTNLLRRKN